MAEGSSDYSSRVNGEHAGMAPEGGLLASCGRRDLNPRPRCRQFGHTDRRPRGALVLSPRSKKPCEEVRKPCEASGALSPGEELHRDRPSNSHFFCEMLHRRLTGIPAGDSHGELSR